MTTTNKVTTTLAAALALTFGAAAAEARQHSDAHTQHAQQSAAPSQDCPPAARQTSDHSAHGDKTKGHDGHHAAVNERGERAMGFSQTRTTHHFFLKMDGGVIQVEANDAGDAESRDRVRKHLAEIARAFAAGDFRTPFVVHDRTPPGAREMCRLRSSIEYKFEETGRGGRVVIRTRDKEALAAVHAFLRFQIEDHRTGDKLEVTN